MICEEEQYHSCSSITVPPALQKLCSLLLRGCLQISPVRESSPQNKIHPHTCSYEDYMVSLLDSSRIVADILLTLTHDVHIVSIKPIAHHLSWLHSYLELYKMWSIATSL